MGPCGSLPADHPPAPAVPAADKPYARRFRQAASVKRYNVSLSVTIDVAAAAPLPSPYALIYVTHEFEDDLHASASAYAEVTADVDDVPMLRTATIKNSASPAFPETLPLKVTLPLRRDVLIAVRVHDDDGNGDLKDDRVLGVTQFRLSRLFSVDGKAPFRQPIAFKFSRVGAGEVRVRVAENTSSDAVLLTFAGKGLVGVDKTPIEGYPTAGSYFRLSRFYSNGTQRVLYESEVVSNPEPQWKDCPVLYKADLIDSNDAAAKTLNFELFDQQPLSRAESMGSFTASLAELVANAKATSSVATAQAFVCRKDGKSDGPAMGFVHVLNAIEDQITAFSDVLPVTFPLASPSTTSASTTGRTSWTSRASPSRGPRMSSTWSPCATGARPTATARGPCGTTSTATCC